MLDVACLWGSDHTELGVIATETLGERIGLGISRGRFPKGYPYVDPNEDVVLAATDGTTDLLAVLDGHNGFDAARAATQAILDRVEDLFSLLPEEAAAEAITVAGAAVRDAVSGLTGVRRSSGTTICVAVVAGSRLAVASAGDSTAVLVGEDSRVLTRTTPALGHGRYRFDEHPITAVVDAGDRLVVATDGLWDFLGGADRLRPELLDSPRLAVSRLIEAAFNGGAGDNVGVAVRRGSAGEVHVRDRAAS
ncbi:MAG: hypothetical protein KatS3mg011_1054 [Acidimicrobiia bacterium]|nr:MAG: hypothetical protein KatS3mg011_1054 [Acidimicrobiia bacterium]